MQSALSSVGASYSDGVEDSRWLGAVLGLLLLDNDCTCISTRACIVSAREPEQEALGRAEETPTSPLLSEGGEGGRREEGLARQRQRAVGKRDVPSGAHLEPSLCLWSKSPGDTQSQRGSPGVWRGLSNILIYFPKLFGLTKPPSPCAKPFPPPSIC